MKSEDIVINGQVIAIRPANFYTVRLPNQCIVNCKLSGKMHNKKIKIVIDDTVSVKVSLYDLSVGIIIGRVS